MASIFGERWRGMGGVGVLLLKWLVMSAITLLPRFTGAFEVVVRCWGLLGFGFNEEDDDADELEEEYDCEASMPPVNSNELAEPMRKLRLMMLHVDIMTPEATAAPVLCTWVAPDCIGANIIIALDGPSEEEVTPQAGLLLIMCSKASS